jgi:hypothetical protein
MAELPVAETQLGILEPTLCYTLPTPYVLGACTSVLEVKCRHRAVLLLVFPHFVEPTPSTTY